MSFSKIILGKDIFDLTYTDLVEYFLTEKEESLNLEFKSFVDQGSFRDKEKVIIKSVCALLNSEGGIIIWGAPTETRNAQGNTTASGELTPFETELDKDRLINKLSSSITPMPLGIKVNFLRNEEAKSIIVIEVDKSIDRPHQYDNRYFVRLDGQTRVAPHYLIKALITSQDFPIIRGHIRLKNIRIQNGNVFITFRKLLFNTSQFNNEKNVFIRLMVNPGTMYINRDNKGSTYDQDYPILSHGRPLMSEFTIGLTHAQVQNELFIMLQFGGEKSPSKTSIYKYNIMANLINGNVEDENIYIIEKDENKLPSDVSNDSDDENINRILDH